MTALGLLTSGRIDFIEKAKEQEFEKRIPWFLLGKHSLTYLFRINAGRNKVFL